MLQELRCPRCNAPVDIQSGIARCRYCGATLVTAAGAPNATFPASPDDAQNPGFLDVHLDEIGPLKISVIKVVRKHLNLGLAEGKNLVDKAPCVLAKAMEGGRAKSFLYDLTAAGAKARGT